MKTNEQLVHPLGEEDLNFKFLSAGGQFHLRGNDEALTQYGGLGAWADMSSLQLLAATKQP